MSELAWNLRTAINRDLPWIGCNLIASTEDAEFIKRQQECWRDTVSETLIKEGLLLVVRTAQQISSREDCRNREVSNINTAINTCCRNVYLDAHVGHKVDQEEATLSTSCESE
jgi:hypothetical protein